MAGDELEHSEIEAVLEARRELGLSYDTELVEGFAERIERAVDRRVSDELSARFFSDQTRESAGKRQLALGIVSLASGIPTTAIALAVPESGELSFLSLIVAWGGITVINVAHAFQGRSRD